MYIVSYCIHLYLRGSWKNHAIDSLILLQLVNCHQQLFLLLPLHIFPTIFKFQCNCFNEFSSECYDEDHIPWLYPQARGIIYALKDKGIEMAIASRSPTSDVAKAFLAKLGIQSMFTVQVSFAINSYLIGGLNYIHRLMISDLILHSTYNCYGNFCTFHWACKSNSSLIKTFRLFLFKSVILSLVHVS